MRWTFQIRAEVFVVIPAYQQAMAERRRPLAPRRYVTHTWGKLDDVLEGQVYLMTVTCRLHRVVHAQLMELRNDH